MRRIEVRCNSCGWEGTWDETDTVLVKKSFGYVLAARCPICMRGKNGVLESVKQCDEAGANEAPMKR